MSILQQIALLQQLLALYQQLLASETPTTTAQVQFVAPNPYVPQNVPSYVVPVEQPTVPSQPVLGSAPQEDCTLSAKPINAANPDLDQADGRDGDYSWTSDNVPSSTHGQLYWVYQEGIGGGNTQTVTKAIGPAITQSQGEEVIVAPPGLSFGHGGQVLNFHLQLDQATCDTSYTNQ